MTEHTPTPWGLKAKYVLGPDNLLICDPSGNSNDAANAAFIVRACNAHEELIESLKAVMAVARFYMRQANGFSPDALSNPNIGSHSSVYEQAFDALAKADGLTWLAHPL